MEFFIAERYISWQFFFAKKITSPTLHSIPHFVLPIFLSTLSTETLLKHFRKVFDTIRKIYFYPIPGNFQGTWLRVFVFCRRFSKNVGGKNGIKKESENGKFFLHEHIFVTDVWEVFSDKYYHLTERMKTFFRMEIISSHKEWSSHKHLKANCISSCENERSLSWIKKLMPAKKLCTTFTKEMIVGTIAVGKRQFFWNKNSGGSLWRLCFPYTTK